MNAGKCGILLLLDLSDTVVHELLLSECEKIRIEGSALAYLKSYLENRTFCVQIGETFSKKKTLERGVPQRIVLGPILFCSYTVELSYLLTERGVDFKLFADDTQLYLTLNDVQDTKTRLSDIMVDSGRSMNCKQLKLKENNSNNNLLFVIVIVEWSCYR